MSEPDSDDRITVYSDYVCPFCYLGRKSLAQYQDERDEPLTVDWHPYDLRARERGPDGELRDDAENDKDEEYYEQALENVERLSEEYDVEMEPHIATDVDSLPAQLASYRVREEYPYERWLAFDEAVFDALWTEREDIGDVDLLAELAADADVDPEVVREAVADAELRAAVEERFAEARQQGISGVPTFAYDGYAARGAVPPAQLKRLVEGT